MIAQNRVNAEQPRHPCCKHRTQASKNSPYQIHLVPEYEAIEPARATKVSRADDLLLVRASWNR
jgi:hypothetical protein